MAEKLSTHPHLTKRVKALFSDGTPVLKTKVSKGFYQDKKEEIVQTEEVQEEKVENEKVENKDDHSRFMPS